MRKMKDSRIPWIGDIPQEWKCGKIGYYSSITKLAGFEFTNYFDYETGGNVIAIRGLNLKNFNIDLTDIQTISDEISDMLPRSQIKQNDILVSYAGTVGNIGLIEDGIVRYHLAPNVGKITIINNSIFVRYMAYYFISAAAQEEIFQLKNKNAQESISMENLRKVKVVVPSADNQKVIAGFLDAKCAEIDALSADVQSEIDTLEAYKRSKIFDTLMHGIKHTKYVNTNSDVWNTIPDNWELVKIKYIFEIVKRIAGKEGYDILAITQQGLKVKDISSNEGQIASDYSGYQFVYPGDFAMNHMDLLTGWVDLSDKFGVTSPDYRVFRLRYPDRFDRKYYKYVMQCCYMCRIFYSLGQGVSNLGRWRLQTSAFNDFMIPVPLYKEQVEIGEYLDKEITQINDVIMQKQEQLSVIADYKKSLIYEYVTGKKEVL